MEITGLILAGGRGTRMGGQDKGLVTLQGQPLIAHVAVRLRPQVTSIMVSANRNEQAYAAFGPVLPDAQPDYPGPLAGLLAGLRACPTDWLLGVPCDALGVPLTLADQFSASVIEADARAAYATIGEDALYPCCLLHRALRDDLAAWLADGHQAVRHWLSAVGAVATPIRGWSAQLINLNTPADLARASPGIPPPPDD